MYRILKNVIILLSISFLFGQNWNSKGTIPVTFRVRVEPYLPPDEIMVIDIKKNGAVETGGNSIYYQHPGKRNLHYMKTIQIHSTHQQHYALIYLS